MPRKNKIYKENNLEKMKHYIKQYHLDHKEEVLKSK
jgi:hypothetical protein